MEPALFGQSSSRAKVGDASRDLAAIRNQFINPAHLTKPECWPLSEGSTYEMMAYCYYTMSQYLALGANDKTLKFRFFK